MCVKYGSPLDAALHSKQFETLALLLQRGAHFETFGHPVYGNLLSTMAYLGHNDIVSLLPDRGADIDIICGKYRTPLGAPLHGKRFEPLPLLLERDANFHIVECGEYCGNLLSKLAYLA